MTNIIPAARDRAGGSAYRQTGRSRLHPRRHRQSVGEVREGEKERLQAYEGIVIARSGTRPHGKLHRTEDFLRRGRRARLPGAQPNIDRSKSSAAARSAAQSSTTCAIVAVSRPVSSSPPTPAPKKLQEGEREAATEAKNAREAEKVAAAEALATELAAKDAAEAAAAAETAAAEPKAE